MPPGHSLPRHRTGPQVGENFPLLETAKNLLGRGKGVMICLPWFHVSRQQAVIEFCFSGSWKIEDLQSRHGTFVNGQKLPSQTWVVLREGDRICIGAPRPGAVELLFTYQPTSQLTPHEEYERDLEADDFGNDSITDLV